ncbi:MAG: preprotein translocase subunit SecE [Alkalicoccus sp.]|uniref:Protein translocase subunit SecE n=1 Tax=Alkalicoccus saliphilus TaxID=200989 RepID=A0A2T4U518_9BACI|nr:preprotein translocase subunit SecE [Alkalicoccus saliphilus]PTL38479.1 preprotein translocase subunit SecE [Alkalicoccus saliphilus]TVP86270.1 MAG: preprotein translocase subunit SecE [Alkalicoccus sp.]
MAEGAKKPVRFLKEVTTEMKRVTWPTGRELRKYTGVVVATVTFIAIFFAISDFIISSLLQLIAN